MGISLLGIAANKKPNSFATIEPSEVIKQKRLEKI
jgi:hypothetical protein